MSSVVPAQQSAPSTPSPATQTATPAPSSAQDATTADDAARGSTLYVYPSKGQSAEQMDRDRYECYVWAVDQTGFDPSQPQLAPHQRVEVVPAPESAVIPGAVTGAVIGAAVSNPRHAAEGAIVGAVIGGVLGGASDAARAKETERVRKRMDEREAQQLAELEEKSNNYRRALSACLEGRGYTVK